MNTASEISNVDPRKILTAFAQYGFRKTSMEDIAQAAGLSRQSIYKKFGSKESCYDWTLKAYMVGLYSEVFAALENDDCDPLTTLENVFDIIVGDAVVFANTAHGAELLDHSLSAAASLPENWPETYHDRLGAFLFQHGFAATQEHARDLAHALITASRGALINATTRQEFSQDMRRILTAVLPK